MQLPTWFKFKLSLAKDTGVKMENWFGNIIILQLCDSVIMLIFTVNFCETMNLWIEEPGKIICKQLDDLIHSDFSSSLHSWTNHVIQDGPEPGRSTSHPRKLKKNKKKI